MTAPQPQARSIVRDLDKYRAARLCAARFDRDTKTMKAVLDETQTEEAGALLLYAMTDLACTQLVERHGFDRARRILDDLILGAITNPIENGPPPQQQG